MCQLYKLKNKIIKILSLKNWENRDFSSGTLPANAGDMGSILGPGRSHMLRSN